MTKVAKVTPASRRRWLVTEGAGTDILATKIKQLSEGCGVVHRVTAQAEEKASCWSFEFELSSESIAKQPQQMTFQNLCFFKRKSQLFNNWQLPKSAQGVLVEIFLFRDLSLQSILQSTSKVFVTTESVELSRVQRLLSSLINLLQG